MISEHLAAALELAERLDAQAQSIDTTTLVCHLRVLVEDAPDSVQLRGAVEAYRKIIDLASEAYADVDALDYTGAHVSVARHARAEGLSVAAAISREALGGGSESDSDSSPQARGRERHRAVHEIVDRLRSEAPALYGPLWHAIHAEREAR